MKRNLMSKVLSLFLASLIWITIKTNTEQENAGKIQVADELPRTLTQPLVPQPQNKPATAGQGLSRSEPFTRPVAILKPPGDPFSYRLDPAEVKVVVRGEKQLLQDMDTKAIQVFVNITDKLEQFRTAANSRGVPVYIEAYCPPGVELAQVEPSLASITRIAPEPPKVEATTNLTSGATATNTVATVTNAPIAATTTTNAVNTQADSSSTNNTSSETTQ